MGELGRQLGELLDETTGTLKGGTAQTCPEPAAELAGREGDVLHESAFVPGKVYFARTGNSGIETTFVAEVNIGSPLTPPKSV